MNKMLIRYMKEHINRAVNMTLGECLDTEAEHLFRGLLKTYPNHVETLNQLGLLAIEGKAPTQAVALLGKALKQRRNDPTLLTNYAICSTPKPFSFSSQPGVVSK